MKSIDRALNMANALLRSFRKGLAYTAHGGALYLALTNVSNSKTLLSIRGPSFVPPPDFESLEDGTAGEPAAPELAAIVQRFYEEGYADVSDMGDNDSGVTFAGLGEPLLRLEVLLDTVQLVKETNHGVPFRVVTNGLVEYPADVAAALKGSGVASVSISLMAHTPPLYNALMDPQDGRSFGDVCCFIEACAAAGLVVECTAVDMTDAVGNEAQLVGKKFNANAVRQLAMSLGAHEFRLRTYHDEK